MVDDDSRPPTVVLLDLDGVIRHFDPELVADIERRHGLQTGVLQTVAFARPWIEEVVTGRITRARWIQTVGDRVGSSAAAQEWGRQPWRLDEEVLALCDGLRAAGRLVAVLTNGTDTIDAELASCGVDTRVDHVFNSAVIGHAKPDARAFQHVLAALAVEPGRVFFTDDSATNLAGAQRVGLRTHLFAGVAGLRQTLTSRRVCMSE